MAFPLLLSTFVIATCGLVYELLAGTVASYLLGDSVTQFSTVIGVYLSAMGLGSFLSRYLSARLIPRFIQLQILVALAGGCSALGLFVAFTYLGAVQFVLYAWVAGIGVLVGMEIPLLLRILKDQLQFADLVSKVLSLDYAGALAASLLFPLWLVPKLGLVRTSFLFGMGNAAVALWCYRRFRAHLGPTPYLQAQAAGALALLAAGFAGADTLADTAERKLYTDEVVFVRSTPYQRIVLTRAKNDLRLFLNGHLQFSSFDEYRYHEALVHPGLSAVANPERVLVLGGGDGLAVRELLRDGRPREIVLVDLDAGMTDLFRDHPLISALNGGALRDPRVRVVNQDAFVWLGRGADRFDFVVVDFPDPSNFSLGKLYTTTFYELLKRRLAPGGAAVIQATSPLFARRSFWCVAETLRAAGLRTTPYHAYVPSFGEWGFVLATLGAYAPPARYPAGLRFLTAATAATLFEFPADMSALPVEVIRLNNQGLVQYYDDEWRRLAP
ncbi:MAG: polyamine aminopropyltransferase [Planctomycetes bacterium]|nr:polyamine aminopropyltransferase [Planctomycetota bacterium]